MSEFINLKKNTEEVNNPQRNNEHELLMTMEGPKYAGFWIRLLSYIIDCLILGVIVYAVTLPFIVFLAILNVSVVISEYLVVIVAGSIAFSYFSILPTTSMQATPGKKAVGLYIGDANGGRISFWRSALRYALTFVSAQMIIGYLMIFFNKEKRALHDYLTSTYVYKK